MEAVPELYGQIMPRLEQLLAPTGLSPEEQQAIQTLTGVGGEQTAAAIARAQSRAMRMGRTAGTPEAAMLSEAQRAGTLATQQAIAPILLQSAQRQAAQRQQLAGAIMEIGKLDVGKQWDATMRLTDRMIQAGQFDISQLANFRSLGVQLLQQEIESLRKKGMAEAELAATERMKMAEMENKLEQIRVAAEEKWRYSPEARMAATVPGGGPMGFYSGYFDTAGGAGPIPVAKGGSAGWGGFPYFTPWGPSLGASIQERAAGAPALYKKQAGG